MLYPNGTITNGLNSNIIIGHYSRMNFGDISIVCFLCLLTVVTILGNFLVMCAIFVKAKLRQNVTNCFIASLAAADLLLGTVVMPFAIIEFHSSVQINYLTKEQLAHFVAWPYGQVWCDLWHAFDVLSSTASILNLCVISVERYIAISDPFNYQSRMTHSRALVMIAIAWICSAFISFPAIVWWRYSSAKMRTNLLASNSTVVSLTTECIFPEDQLYLFLSSCVSFHIPLVVMVFVYWKIYRTATRVMQSLKSGTALVDGSPDGERLVLRVHRGGSNRTGQNNCQNSIATSSVSVLPPSSCVIDQPESENHSACDSEASTPMVPVSLPPLDVPQELCNPATPKPARERHVRFARHPTALNRFSEHRTYCLCCCSPCVCFGWTLIARLNSTSNGHNDRLTDSSEQDEVASPVHPADRKKRSFHFKKRLKRFSQEQRAAKTLGVIMGTFICCWLPFFIYNTIKSISPSLIREHDYIIFPLFTWLGFINSSINPFIYAFQLRDIRRVFQEALCKWCPQRK